MSRIYLHISRDQLQQQGSGCRCLFFAAIKSPATLFIHDTPGVCIMPIFWWSKIWEK